MVTSVGDLTEKEKRILCIITVFYLLLNILVCVTIVLTRARHELPGHVKTVRLWYSRDMMPYTSVQLYTQEVINMGDKHVVCMVGLGLCSEMKNLCSAYLN
jgi:hypothetical protein